MTPLQLRLGRFCLKGLMATLWFFGPFYLGLGAYFGSPAFVRVGAALLATGLIVSGGCLAFLISRYGVE